MRYPGFIGGSYAAQAILADVEESTNWYLEVPPEGQQGAKPALLPTPGFRQFVRVADVGTRGLFYRNGRAFGVVGSGFYEIFANGTATKWSTVINDGNLATISDNGNGGQLLITSGTNAYCFVLATNTLTQVLTGEATMGGTLDSYGLAFNRTTGKVRLSNPNDLTTWDPTQFFQRSIAPDPWQAMVVDNASRQITLIGEETGEVWYDAGTSPLPFQPIPGAVFGSGIAAPFAFALASGQLVWLERHKNGSGRVMAARGYVPAPISDYAVDTAVGGYGRTYGIGDAEALVYEDGGHTFFNLAFPAARATHTVDIDRPSWHRRGAWLTKENRFDIWRPRVTCYAFGRHLVGDRASGIIAEMDATVGTEVDGSAIRRVRRAPGLNSERRRIRYDAFYLDLDAGVGAVTGQGADPMVMLRCSDNGGKTWGSERRASAGPLGRYGTRCVWHMLGASDNRVFEVSVSDPVPFRLVDAYINNIEGVQAA